MHPVSRPSLFTRWQRAAQLGLALLLVPFAAAAAATQEELEQRFRKANEQFEAGDYAGTIEGCNEIIEAVPKADNVWVLRALARWSMHDKSGARADLAQALTLTEDNPEVYRARAAMRAEENQNEQAMEDIEQAIALDSSVALYFGMRGELRSRLNDASGAVDDFTRALEIDVNYTAARYARARQLEFLNRTEEALRDYDVVIEAEPKYADALNQRAWLRYHALDFPGALSDGRRAAELAPQAAVVARIVGYSLFAQGEFEQAADVLAHAADLVSKEGSEASYALIVRHIALVHIKQPDGRLEQAWAAWTDDVWAQALARFVLGQLSEDDLDKLAEEPEDAEERNGRTCEAHFYIGWFRLQQGDRASARLRFKSAVATAVSTYVEYTLAEAELRRM